MRSRPRASPMAVSTDSQHSSHSLASGRAKAWERGHGARPAPPPLLGLGCRDAPVLLAQPYLPHVSRSVHIPETDRGLSQPARPGEGGAEQGQTERWQLGSWCLGRPALSHRRCLPDGESGSGMGHGGSPPFVGWGRRVSELPAWSRLPPSCYYRVHGLHPRPSPPLGPGWSLWPRGLTGPGARLQPTGQGLIPGRPQEAREQAQVQPAPLSGWEEGHSDMEPRTRVWGSWPGEGVLVPGCPTSSAHHRPSFPQGGL